jgi:uncharacterized integral membrane protein
MAADDMDTKGGNAIRRLIIAGVIIALAVWFILANTEEVSVKLWLVEVQTPMWIMITIVFAAGWAVGALLRRRSARKRG